MSKKTLERTLPVLLCVLGTTGCMDGTPALEGNDPSSLTLKGDAYGKGAIKPRGFYNIQLASNHISRFKEVNVDIQRVSLLGSNGKWSDLGNPNKIVNATKLQGGITEPLAEGQLDAGNYQAVLFGLGPRNTVKLHDGSVYPLKMAALHLQGMQLPLAFEAKGGERKDLVVDFNIDDSIHLMGPDSAREFVLRPHLRALDLAKSGMIAGKLTNAATGLPIAGATVYAEQRLAPGKVQIVRRAFSQADGSYQLDLLPLDASYIVVSQPKFAAQSFGAQVSNNIALSMAKPNGIFDAAFTSAAQVGSVQVQVAPIATELQSDTCSLLQGEETAQYIVADGVTSQSTLEQVQFDYLPIGYYETQCDRLDTQDSGIAKVTTSQQIPAQVAAAATQAVQVAF